MADLEDKWLDRHCWRNKSRLYRYFAMLMLCTLGFGLFLTYDSLGALQDTIMTNLNLNAVEFSYLYSISTWPNVVLCLFGGFLVDKIFGIKAGTTIYVSVASGGHFIFALGILLNTYWCSLLGRFIFGIGVEFINICLQYYSVIYFKGKELGMVICLIIAIARLGSSAMFEMASPLLASIRRQYVGNEDVGIVLFIVGSFTIASVISSLVLFFMNPKESKERNQEKQASEQVKLSDVLHFDVTFWLAITTASCNALNVYIFIPYSQAFFMTEYELTMEEANSYASYFSLMGAAFAPLIGITVDQVGREISFICLGFILGCTSHIILAFTTITPYFTMFLLALSFGFVTASLTPILAYIVPEKTLGTAYGINQAAINLTYSVVITVAGVIADGYGYQALEIYVFANVLVGLIAAVILWILDFNRQGNLNWSSAKRRQQNKIELRLSETKPLNIEN